MRKKIIYNNNKKTVDEGMKKVDSGEYFSSEQDNIFSEYESFPAEEYYSSEFSKSPEETGTFDESFNNEGVNSTKGDADGQSDFNDVKKEYDRLNGDSSSSEPSAGADSSSTSATSSSGANAANTAGSTSGSAASTGGVAGGTVAGAGATAVAIIVVSAAVTGGFIANVDNYVGDNYGADYVSITVDMDEILSQSSKTYALSASDFSIEFNKGNNSVIIPLLNGKHSYLVTGLQPDKSYTYNLICSNPSLGSNSSCYSKTLSTLNSDEPKGVYDELNNYITYDEATRTASVYYSVYLSDCQKILSDSTLYLCSSEQTDFSNVNHVVYSDGELDENNFFKGSADGITYDELYLYVVAHSTADAQAEAMCLFSQRIEVGLPDDWVESATPAFVVDEHQEEITCRPDSIYISSGLNKLNENYTYHAYVTQYGEDGTVLVENDEAALSVDLENMTYTVEVGAYYGVKTFKYVIYADDLVVYDSGEKQFTTDQAYSATYTKVQPADTSIEYSASGVIITVDTAFTSTYENYEYKLVVTNSTDNIYGQYQGTGVATIEIADYTGLDQINFTYYDLGTFADGEIEFASHTTTAITGQAYFVVDGTAEAINTRPDSISISGKLTDLNENYTYYAYVTQYGEDGTVLVENDEGALSVDLENMTYTVEFGAYYGVKTFKYVIYADDLVIYDGGEKQFTASQEFGASYTKVQPVDASIEYSASGVTITVDTAFTSAYENYEYKLVVTNSTGEVYGQYQGKGEAVIEIADYTGLDEINFTYYDLGTFAGGEVEFASHTTTAIVGQAYFVVDGTAEAINTQPDRISVSGKLTNLNGNYTYHAYVTQYDEDGTALGEDDEGALSVDLENMTYTVEVGAYYGVKTFKYVIYAGDLVVYDSGEKQFTADQAYSAIYTKVQPADTSIEYSASGVIITVDTAFTSTYENYEYKLVVTNSTGDTYGQYQGTGIATIEIADYTGLDQINFTYYDLGTFADGEIEFASYTTTAIVGHAYFVVDEGEEVVTTQPDSISVSGKITNLNQHYTYTAYVTQYDEDGTALVENDEGALGIDLENMTYTVEVGAYYGVKTFKYVIYAGDLVVYDSGEKQFTADQAYNATYTKVQPAEASIEYSASGVTITVDTAFTSAYENYEYKLVVTNSTGNIYGQYQGTGVATIEIADYTGLDQINFTYYDLGAFADGEQTLGEHTTEGVAFCVPALTLGAEYGFDGQYFTLSYSCDMAYDYANASIDIDVTDGAGLKIYTKHVESVSASGTIILDNYDGEFGSVTVSATLNFKDNQSDGAVHSLQSAQADYVMNYSFEVTKVVADTSGKADLSGMESELMLIELSFDYLLPDGYKIKITDEANSLDKSTELVNSYSFSELSRTAEVNLTIQVTDADGNAWGEAKSVTISKSAAEAAYTSPSMNCLNPSDGVVTYNDDGTVNVYLNVDFSCEDENVYYKAMLRAGYYDEEYNFVETERFDFIGRDKYAVIENIPNQNYVLYYYQMFDYNGVSYIIYIEIPSGSIENVYKDEDEDGYEDFATAAAIVADGQTTITVNLSSSGMLGDKIIVDGIEYTYTTYSGEYDTNPTLVIYGEIDLASVTEVTVTFTKQGENYDAYAESGEITMKGSKYGKHIIKVSAVEA